MKCKYCENRKYYDLLKEIASKSIIVTHKESLEDYSTYENMVNTTWVIDLIKENFKLK